MFLFVGENILLSGDHKKLFLADFGLAARFSETEKFLKKVGTRFYMAPEVQHCDGRTPYTPKCDMWSVGCVIVHMDNPRYGLKAIAFYLNTKCKVCFL